MCLSVSMYCSPVSDSAVWSFLLSLILFCISDKAKSQRRWDSQWCHAVTPITVHPKQSTAL